MEPAFVGHAGASSRSWGGVLLPWTCKAHGNSRIHQFPGTFPFIAALQLHQDQLSLPAALFRYPLLPALTALQVPGRIVQDVLSGPGIGKYLQPTLDTVQTGYTTEGDQPVRPVTLDALFFNLAIHHSSGGAQQPSGCLALTLLAVLADQLGHAIAHLGAFGNPAVNMFQIDAQSFFIFLGYRIEKSQALDVAAITGIPGIRSNDVVERALFRTGSGKTNGNHID